MSMTPEQVERKVRQLDNNVESIHELLSTIQSTQQRHTNRLGELVEQVGARETKVDERFGAVDERFEGVDARFEAIDARFDSLDAKVDTVLDLLRDR